MRKLLHPDLYVRFLTDIPLSKLRNQGISGLIIDLDNTVAEWGCVKLTRKVRVWFADLKKHELKACLVSNNRGSRVQTIAERLNIPAISRAGKPRRRSFRQAMAILGTGAGDTAVIGDQVLTDVLGGNRLGLYTILVMPINKREFIGTKLIRLVENLVTRHLVLSDLKGNE